MRPRKFLLLFFMIMFVFSVSASVYSTFPYDQEQQSDDLSTHINLGVVNAGDQSLELRFDTKDSREYNVSLPEKVELEPSEIEESPQGEDWKYLGNGKYAEIQDYSFKVDISRYRESNRIDIPLRIMASPADEMERGSTASISQETTHDYTVLLNPRLRPLERETEEEREVYYEKTDEKSLPEDWREDKDSDSENESKDYKANRTDEKTGERESKGLDTVTMMLVLAIIASAGYLFRVI